ncbi:MAG: amidohydrolase [Oscillospiraceae bacterium]|nr:amidohydrolase [Oscillospiraceae bacterium]
MNVPVIDVHTHMLSREFLAVLKEHGGPIYSVEDVPVLGGTSQAIHKNGAMFMTLFEEMFDYDLRLQKMNDAKVDIAIVSLTCPNVYWGDVEISASTARLINDNMIFEQSRNPDRIRFLCSLPWQYPEEAIKELDRAVSLGAVGVMVIANIAEKQLIDPMFAPVWEAIDKHSLPVLVHPSLPPGSDFMQLDVYHLAASTGFLIDTTLAISTMIMDGFFDRYQNLKIIASHGGGTLPYTIGRLDQIWKCVPAGREKIDRLPSSYMPQIFADSVVYRQSALQLCVAEFGEDNVLYGSDFPHNIGDMVGILERVDAMAAGPRDKIRSKNAQRIFNL